ncbi:MAG: UxaA family hydrolase [Verrucomicrobiota bacterium]
MKPSNQSTLTGASRLLQLSPEDNVLIAAGSMLAGSVIKIGGEMLIIRRSVNMGAKIALYDIDRGEKVIKFGAPIGSATTDIEAGEHVHVHNLASDYIPTRLSTT